MPGLLLQSTRPTHFPQFSTLIYVSLSTLSPALAAIYIGWVSFLVRSLVHHQNCHEHCCIAAARMYVPDRTISLILGNFQPFALMLLFPTLIQSSMAAADTQSIKVGGGRREAGRQGPDDLAYGVKTE